MCEAAITNCNRKRKNIPEFGVHDVDVDVLSNRAVAPDQVDHCKACQPAIVNEARRRPLPRSANEIISNSR